MEFVPPMPTWEDLEKGGVASGFQPFRGPPEVGRKLILEDDVFVENVLPGGVVRGLTEEQTEHYRAQFLEPPSREPLDHWANEVPIEGKSADMYGIAEKYHAWFLGSEAAELFFWATSGIIIGGGLAGWYRKTLRNTRSVCIGPGRHYLQEDNPRFDWQGTGETD